MKKLIIANWKMNPNSLDEARKLFYSVEHRMHLVSDKAEVAVLAPYIFLPLLSHHSSYARLGAQDMFWLESGAFTGEVSVKQLKNFKIDYILLGHSERRMFFGETDAFINLKLHTALKHKLIPIVCLGGDAKVTKATSKKLVTKQFSAAIKAINKKDIEKIVFVYEPTWAISTMKHAHAANGEDASEITIHIRSLIAKHIGVTRAANMRILYGGSVSKTNVNEFAKYPTIDGALVGAASLDPENFFSVVKEFHRESIHKS